MESLRDARMMDRTEKNPKREGEKLIQCSKCLQVLNLETLPVKSTFKVCPECGGNHFRPFVRGEVEVK